jgi:formate-dependent nitrite reductase membrane component NrfD
VLQELVVTRHNPLVDPVLRVWAWEIPVYLFLGGWVAGMMVLSGLFLIQGRHRQRPCTCVNTPWVGLALLTAGMFALFLDLESKRHVWRLYTTFRIASPMSWGAWILLLVYPALLAAILVDPPAWLLRALPAAARAQDRLARQPRLVRAIGLANVSLGGALGIYTGILLASLGARPLWNSAMLGPLFLLSGLSSAAAFVHLVADDAGERELLARADNVFLGLELAALGLFLAGLVTATAAHRQAAALLLGGPYTAPFWVGVVGLGIALPLVIQSLAVARRIGHTPVAPLLVLAGGLVLRFVIVIAGQESRWAAAAAGLVHQIV